MGKRVRKIIHIDEALCNGCGQCVAPCAESALEVVNGKARVIREELCDGAGFCIGVCPTGALTIEEREAPDFNEEAVTERRAALSGEANNREGHRDSIRCSSCGAGDSDRALIPIRRGGHSEWICVKCLPGLIHG